MRKKKQTKRMCVYIDTYITMYYIHAERENKYGKM